MLLSCFSFSVCTVPHALCVMQFPLSKHSSFCVFLLSAQVFKKHFNPIKAVELLLNIHGGGTSGWLSSALLQVLQMRQCVVPCQGAGEAQRGGSRAVNLPKQGCSVVLWIRQSSACFSLHCRSGGKIIGKLLWLIRTISHCSASAKFLLFVEALKLDHNLFQAKAECNSRSPMVLYCSTAEMCQCVRSPSLRGSPHITRSVF